MAFQLRVATMDDVPAIRELIAASVRELQLEYSTEEREAAIATVFTVDSRLIADGTYFVAFAQDGRLAGCGGWSKRRTLYGGDHQVETIEPGLLDPATDAAKIRAIFVHPQSARQGLGSLILRASEEAAMSAGFSQFEMGSTLTGVALYKLKGYREITRMNVPVGSGQLIGVVRMVKLRGCPSGLGWASNYVEEKEDQDDQKDRADAAASVVAEAGPHAITAESEYQNQDNQKDEHFFLRATRFSQH